MQIYNDLFNTCDLILNILVKTPHHRMMESDLYGKIEEDFKLKFRAALHHLIEEKLIKADPHPHYLLLGLGSILQANGGYKSKFEEENTTEKIQKAIEELGLKSANSVIETNTSIQILNKNTEIFYEKQTSFNRWQKWLTITIMASTVSYTIISFLTWKTQKKQIEQEQKNLQSTTQELKFQILQDSVFLKSLKDSLNSQ